MIRSVIRRATAIIDPGIAIGQLTNQAINDPSVWPELDQIAATHAARLDHADFRAIHHVMALYRQREDRPYYFCIRAPAGEMSNTEDDDQVSLWHRSSDSLMPLTVKAYNAMATGRDPKVVSIATRRALSLGGSPETARNCALQALGNPFSLMAVNNLLAASASRWAPEVLSALAAAPDDLRQGKDRVGLTTMACYAANDTSHLSLLSPSVVGETYLDAAYQYRQDGTCSVGWYRQAFDIRYGNATAWEPILGAMAAILQQGSDDAVRSLIQGCDDDPDNPGVFCSRIATQCTTFLADAHQVNGACRLLAALERIAPRT